MELYNSAKRLINFVTVPKSSFRTHSNRQLIFYDLQESYNKRTAEKTN